VSPVKYELGFYIPACEHLRFYKFSSMFRRLRRSPFIPGYSHGINEFVERNAFSTGDSEHADTTTAWRGVLFGT
jgi:hypothetical protein